MPHHFAEKLLRVTLRLSTEVVVSSPPLLQSVRLQGHKRERRGKD
jgi:hypothetical protein